MANKGKPCAFLLILFLCLASFITVKALDKSDTTLTKCIKGCQRKYPQSPEERYRACQQHCESTELQHRPECRQQCIDKYKKERKDDNPYAFEEQHFTTLIESQHGSLRILQKFLDHSKLLSGINSFRFGFLEVGPHALLVPSHLDANLLNVVLRGRGRVSLVRSKGRESLSLQPGDIYRIPAGTTAYLININKTEKLEIASLIQPVSTPSKFQAFFGAVGQNPKGFLTTFSPELLEAAYKVNRDRLQRFLGQKNEGFFVDASEEQIRALSDQAGEKGSRPFGKSRSTVNILHQRPVHSNKYGEIRDVKPDDFKPLEDLNVGVAFANITQGAMSTMFFNSKATKICVVPNGKGYIQMACPQLSSSSSEESEQGHGNGGSHEQSPGYKQLNTQLRPGIVFIAPPGHPFVMVASSNQKLEVLCFVINARNNERTPLAGIGTSPISQHQCQN
ncbi:vicilin Cor a 11.0101-like [Daucus carota subsp. sativus]|uniref:vicilin Cor a 11.0101-like n=1 Tax=Daucus carota subsp. sativus TaxID=79200 RepID=UPI003083CFCA